MVWCNSKFTYLSNMRFSTKAHLSVWCNSKFTYLSNSIPTHIQGCLFGVIQNLHISQTIFCKISEPSKFGVIQNLHISQT